MADSPSYEIWLTTDTGKRIALLDNCLGAQFERVANGPGQFAVNLPASFDTRLITAPDRMVQFWRAPRGGRLALFRTYFVRYWRWAKRRGRVYKVIMGPCVNDLLRRRIVAAYAESSNAKATATEADNLMKDIVTDMESDAINPTPTAGTRAWADLSVQGDLTLGPQLTKAFAWRNVLDIVRDLGDAAKTAGTEIWFDVAVSNVTSSSIALEFRTTTGQPGRDLTDLGAVFDEARGNMADPEYSEDWREEANYIYAGGLGHETNREIQQVYDADRYNLSQWARSEAFCWACDQDAANGVRESGRAALAAAEPVRVFRARALDTSGFRFGRDWTWGDKVTARFLDRDFDCIIKRVAVYVDERGQETVDAWLEYEA